MTPSVSQRVSQLKPSATMAINAKANQLRQSGEDIINLSVGEPDFDTPAFIKSAAIEAIQSGFTKYTAAEGIPELKAAIIHKLATENHLSYENQQVIACSGVKQCLYNLTQAALNAGDEVIIPAPYWVSYPAMVQLADATSVFIPTTLEQRMKITPEQLSRAITPRTRMFMLNSPSNPSGMAYTADELIALAEVLKAHPDIIIATDDIYEYILWSHPFVNILNVCPELYDRTVVMNGLSKAHAMTGWRVGYAAGPENLINAMKKIQSQSTSNVCSIAQKAAVTALLADPDSFFPPMLEAYKRRHDLVFAALSKMPGVSCLPSDGTFYLFPSFEGVIARLGLDDDVALAEYLLESAHVAVVPGTAFGMPNHIRISCATSDENLIEAISRIEKALAG